MDETFCESTEMDDSSNMSTPSTSSGDERKRSTRKRKLNIISANDNEEPVNKRETDHDTITLGYVNKGEHGDQNVIRYVKFIGVAPLSVYPRGKDNVSFNPDPLEQQQTLYLNSIEKLFKIAFGGLRYADGSWQDPENMDRKLKDIKKMCNEELQHYGWKIANNFIECRNAFLEGMYNSAGRAAICDILELVGGLFSKQHNYFIMNVGGGSPRYKGSFNIISVQIDKNLTEKPGNSPEMSRVREEELAAALTESTAFKHKRVVPDGQVYFENDAGISIVLTAVVKADKEATDESTYLQTWIQSVGALRKRDITHGVALTCIGGQLVKLLKDSDKGTIMTTFQCYDFKKPDLSFNFEEFWAFFRGLVCILQKG